MDVSTASRAANRVAVQVRILHYPCMNVRFTRHAEGRMARDSITASEVEEVLAHPTNAPRPAGGRRQLARRVHPHRVVSVLYEAHPDGALVVSCWRAMR